jgi:hypothetical protein
MVRHDLWDSELVVPGTGLRRLLIAIISFMGGLLAVVVLRVDDRAAGAAAGAADAGDHQYFRAGARLLGHWLAARLFPAEALYRATVDELIVLFTDLRTRLAVIETVEKTVTTVCACDRAKLVAVSSPRRVRQSDSNMDGRGLRPGGVAPSRVIPDIARTCRCWRCQRVVWSRGGHCFD